MSAANARVGALAGLLGGVGMAFGLAVWLVDQYMLWPAIDQTAAQAFTPWVLAVGHLLFGLSRPCCSAGCRPTAAWVGSSPPDDGRTGFLHPDVLLFVSGHAADFSLGAKPATALERDLGLTGQSEQAEPAGGRTGRPRLGRSIQVGWNGR